jgi:hypothetical protein
LDREIGGHQVSFHQLRQVAINQGILGVVGVNSFSGIAVYTIMQTLVGTWRRDIDNPAMEALPFRMRVGEIMESRPFLGYQLYCHNPILAVCVLPIISYKTLPLEGRGVR